MTIISSLVMICIYYSPQPLQFPEKVLQERGRAEAAELWVKPAGRFCRGDKGSEVLGSKGPSVPSLCCWLPTEEPLPSGAAAPSPTPEALLPCQGLPTAP